jgi:hypothetical protein
MAEGAAGLTEDELELVDPTPSIHDLFVHYRDLYFDGKLGGVSVEWSSARMTSCGGNCQKVPGGAIIKLSRPLLSLRPTRDLKDVLLHEMVHAFMFSEHIRDDDPTGGGHGSYFKHYIASLNASTVPDAQRPPGGYRVSVFHTMVDEVQHYQRHHWRCNRCGYVVKRAVNRPPQEADCRARAGPSCCDPRCRFHSHVRLCGGAFVKTQEPEGYVDKRRRKSAGDASGSPAPKRRGRKGKPITDFFKPGTGHILGRGVEAEGGGASASGSAPHSALAAVLQRPAAGGAAPQGETPVEQRRRLTLQAAVARMQGIGSPASAQSADGPIEGAGGPSRSRAAVKKGTAVIELLGDDDEWEEHDEATAAVPQREQTPADGNSEEDDALEWGGDEGGAGDDACGAGGGGGEDAAGLECPVCGKQWKPGALSNAELNLHVDACLTGG